MSNLTLQNNMYLIGILAWVFIVLLIGLPLLPWYVWLAVGVLSVLGHWLDHRNKII